MRLAFLTPTRSRGGGGVKVQEDAVQAQHGLVRIADSFAGFGLQMVFETGDGKNRAAKTCYAPNGRARPAQNGQTGQASPSG
jgi:hypothetical protein